MKEALGTRMKEFYEKRTRYYLPRKTHALIRVDGKAFHTFTKGMQRPFDHSLTNAMNETAIALCSQIQGAKLAYVQSDEISILLTDFDKLTTEAWFDYNIQKMCSVSASIATQAFNAAFSEKPIALFDSRVWSISDPVEVKNYFLWRQQDCVKNSISSVAQFHFSPKELHKKHQGDMKDMLHEIGDGWEDYPDVYKNGRVILKEEFQKNDTLRTRWVAKSAPEFLVSNENFWDSIL